MVTLISRLISIHTETSQNTIYEMLLLPCLMQLKASLFAAGHICELSEGFAFVVLEMVVSLLASKRACYAVKRAVTHVFAKMGSSYAIACRAYEVSRT